MGTRLRPITRQINKHLVPILNKPMVMYPLETLKHLGVTDIMIVSGGGHIGGFADFFGDGSEFGVSLTYRAQKEAGGIAQALFLAKDFVGSNDAVVILGDNIFENDGLQPLYNFQSGVASIYVKDVSDPHRFGVLAPDESGSGWSIEEKPVSPRTSKAVTGLYVYPPEVFDVIPQLSPSKRGELEITDVNNYFLAKNDMVIKEVGGFWGDAGTPESLYRAIKYVAEKEGLDPLTSK